MIRERDPDNIDKITPLHLAAQDNLERVISFLLKEGKDPNAINSNTETPLHISATLGNVIIDIFLTLSFPLRNFSLKAERWLKF